MGSRRERNLSASSDAELLSLLRAGESDAYTELWRRHISAALRVAHRLVPDRAEDLASESFLSVYRQIMVSGNGPESAFRAYLFTTMRNTAMRWRKEASLVDPDSDPDTVEPEDALSMLEDRARAAEMLAAFEALPARWQRVLWLTEVEEAKRPRIAAELGIKPNAVSALYRRARAGLRLQWLTQQVPSSLREDPGHVAGLLPRLLLEGTDPTEPARMAEHLGGCPECAALDAELRDAHQRMGRRTLAVAGFAGLAVVLPAASQASITAAGVGAAAALLAIGGATLAASLTVFGGGALAPDTSQSSPARGDDGASSASSESSAHPGRTASDTRRSAMDPDGPRTGIASPNPIGRGNDNPGIQTFTFTTDAPPDYFYVPPERPTQTPPGTTPGPGGDPNPGDTPLRAGLATPAAGDVYLAPVLTGTTTPGASIAVEIDFTPEGRADVSRVFSFTAPVDDHGDWNFDLRALSSDMVGRYDYRLWAYTDQRSSAAETGSFTISPPEIAGFESIAPFEMLPLDEASTSGIVFEARGPANGTICLVSVWTGQAAEIALDQNGSAVRRVRMLVGGNYYFDFRACDGDYRGPGTTVLFDVEDPDGPGFGFFGGDPSATEFELSEL